MSFTRENRTIFNYSEDIITRKLNSNIKTLIKSYYLDSVLLESLLITINNKNVCLIVELDGDQTFNIKIRDWIDDFGNIDNKYIKINSYHGLFIVHVNFNSSWVGNTASIYLNRCEDLSTLVEVKGICFIYKTEVDIQKIRKTVKYE